MWGLTITFFIFQNGMVFRQGLLAIGIQPGPGNLSGLQDPNQLLLVNDLSLSRD